jgi:transposase-like protein
MLDAGVSEGHLVWGFRVEVNSEGKRSWPTGLKELATQKIAEGAKVTEIARELGARPSLVAKWVTAARSNKSMGAGAFVEALAPSHATSTRAGAREIIQTQNAHCIIRLGGAEVEVSASFPSNQLHAILRAVRDTA